MFALHVQPRVVLVGGHMGAEETFDLLLRVDMGVPVKIHLRPKHFIAEIALEPFLLVCQHVGPQVQHLIPTNRTLLLRLGLGVSLSDMNGETETVLATNGTLLSDAFPVDL